MSDPIEMTVERVFAQAAEIRSPADREAFLDQACGSDQILRAEVEKLLRHDAAAGSFLENPAAGLQPTADDAPPPESDHDSWLDFLQPPHDPDSIGSLGTYPILEMIGRGGMGVVFRARDPKLNRTVAVKLLAPELAAIPLAVRRFLREAQAAAAVSHDHVVTIHAIDERAKPPMIVMEFVSGKSLQQKLDEDGPPDAKSILRIGMQTAAGLAAAHRQGLVHRDIKPSNILLENGIERVKLTDFGLARAVDDLSMTRTGQITGTPQYMSPEQAMGQRVDYRSDLFSLGSVLYAMCTGRSAFRADTAVASMHRVVHDSPRPIRSINEDIPLWLIEIIDRLLEKDPADRIQSASELETLLGNHLAHLQQPDSVPQPAPLRPVSRSDSTAKLSGSKSLAAHSSRKIDWLRQVPIPAWVALLLFAMVFVGAIVEWSGESAVASRGNGMLFYLLGTGFVLAWGAGSLLARLLHGPRDSASRNGPQPSHLVAFFVLLVTGMGVFVWNWADLHNKTDRAHMLGFFFGHGYIQLTIDDPTTDVMINEQQVEIPDDGRVVLQPKWPGWFLVEITRANGSTGRSELLIHHGQSAHLGSGVFAGATKVRVTGPVRPSP